MEPPKTWGGRGWAQLTGTVIPIGAEGTETAVGGGLHQKRRGIACPPHVAGMMQCTILPRGMCIEQQSCGHPCYLVGLRVRLRV